MRTSRGPTSTAWFPTFAASTIVIAGASKSEPSILTEKGRSLMSGEMRTTRQRSGERRLAVVVEADVQAGAGVAVAVVVAELAGVAVAVRVDLADQVH